MIGERTRCADAQAALLKASPSSDFFGRVLRVKQNAARSWQERFAEVREPNHAAASLKTETAGQLSRRTA